MRYPLVLVALLVSVAGTASLAACGSAPPAGGDRERCGPDAGSVDGGERRTDRLPIRPAAVLPAVEGAILAAGRSDRAADAPAGCERPRGAGAATAAVRPRLLARYPGRPVRLVDRARGHRVPEGRRARP